MKKIFIFILFLTGFIFTLMTTPASHAGPTVFVNLGPYGAVGYPAGYAYPASNGCCGGCAHNYPTNGYYNPYYNNNNPYSYNNQPLNNPYVFDTVNSPWASNVGRIVPTRMNPRNPYGY